MRRALDAIADADPYPYWYDDADEPDCNPTLVRTETCDLCIVGGGYTGLWTAIIAKERDPSRDVVLIDAHEIGSAASGRNGGFMESSLTHGVANGQERFPEELPTARRARPAEPQRDRGGDQAVRHRLRLRAHRRDRRRHRRHPPSLPRRAARRLPTSCARSASTSTGSTATPCRPRSTRRPTPAGCGARTAPPLVDPARLVWGLKCGGESLGVRIYEDTKATAIEKDGVGVLVTTPLGDVRAGKVALGTNAVQAAAASGCATTSRPVYDYCMVTEPLTDRAARPHRLGQPPGLSATSPTSSTTTG